MATLMASEPSATTTHRQPSRLSNVSIILAVMGLSSASRHVTARSLGSGPLLRSMEATEDGGVLTSIWPDTWPMEVGQASDNGPSPILDETDAVRRRLGIEFRRITSASMWFCLNRSTAPYSEGLRIWLATLPGVEGGTLPREGEDAMDEVDVAGDGGFVDVLPSNEVTTLDGTFFLADMLRFRVCAAPVSESVCVMGAIWSVRNFRIMSSLACLSTCRFLNEKEPNSSSAGVVASRPPFGTGTASERGISIPTQFGGNEDWLVGTGWSSSKS